MIMHFQQNKYKNKSIIYDNIKFQSIKEKNRYIELKLLEKANVIKNLELQKKFELQPSYTNNNNENIRAINYIADFFYYNNEKGVFIVEDTKGYKTDVYKIKKKLFEYKYPNLTIKEL